MNKTVFCIDDKEFVISTSESANFSYGEDKCLSNVESDLCFNQDWYQKGYTEADFLSKNEFDSLKKGVIDSIKKIITEETSEDVQGFNLENYHKYIKNDADHFKIVSKTRDLFTSDFSFPITDIINRLGIILGMQLTDEEKETARKMHIIVRINRPNSTDFNPPHKDIYEAVDNESYIPKFINFWIPIVGVTERSSLPIAPESHLINENKILRTFAGAELEGNKYRVRMIKSWDGKNEFRRSSVKDGQVLIFTPHLIHGLAINEENDKTRVALEFRLFKSN